MKSARTRLIRRSVKLEEFPPQNSGVITIVSSLVAKFAHVLAHTGGLKQSITSLQGGNTHPVDSVHTVRSIPAPSVHTTQSA